MGFWMYILGSALGCFVLLRSPLDHFLVDGENMACLCNKAMVLVTKVAIGHYRSMRVETSETSLIDKHFIYTLHRVSSCLLFTVFAKTVYESWNHGLPETWGRLHGASDRSNNLSSFVKLLYR